MMSNSQKNTSLKDMQSKNNVKKGTAFKTFVSIVGWATVSF